MVITGNELELPLLIQAATVRSQAAERLMWHSHEGVELIFLVVGATAYEFEGGRTWMLGGGHFLVVPAHTRHRGLDNVRMPSKLAGLTFDLGRRGKSPVVPFTRAELEWISSCFQESGGGVYPFGATLKEIVEYLESEMAAWMGPRADVGQKASLRTLVCASILEAAREVARRPVERPSQMVVAAVEYLRAHFDEPLQMGALTRHLGLGRARFFDLFTGETGQTPHSYLVRLRLEKATELLRNTRRSITEIAFATGFGSGQHFSRVFRKYRGETPNECRESRRAAKRGNPECG
jgi:AraC-like DNA-binding protein